MRRLVLLFALCVSLVTPAFANPITTLDPLTIALGVVYDGNDCTAWDQNFQNCTLFGSPIIARFGYNEGQFMLTDKNVMFPSIDGTEWSFTGTTWLYVPGPGDPAITFWVRKFGNKFEAYPTNRDVTDVPYASDKLSHISFYDTGTPVPEPASMLLLGTGLLIAGSRIRKRK